MSLDKWLSSAYFIGIVGVLSFGNFGVLTIPGIIVAISCLALIYKTYYSIAAFIAILAATISFLAQAIIGWCVSCIIAAVMFAIAGLLASRRKIQLLFGIPILFGILVFILPNIVSKDSSESYPVTSALHTSKANISDYEKVRNSSIPLLYVSAFCPSCKDILKRYIESDPQGKYWRPVIVSHGQEGDQMLNDMGYTGELYHEIAVSKAVPCLEIRNEKYVGQRNILSAFIPRHN